MAEWQVFVRPPVETVEWPVFAPPMAGWEEKASLPADWVLQDELPDGSSKASGLGWAEQLRLRLHHRAAGRETQRL